MKKKGAHRITTVKPNGGLPESREVAPDDLGEVVIDTALAPEQLRELAVCYEDVHLLEQEVRHAVERLLGRCFQSNRGRALGCVNARIAIMVPTFQRMIVVFKSAIATCSSARASAMSPFVATVNGAPTNPRSRRRCRSC